MTLKRPVSHDLPFRSDAEIEDRVSQLKLLAGVLPKPTDRLHCLAELLYLRSQQHQSHMPPRSAR